MQCFGMIIKHNWFVGMNISSHTSTCHILYSACCIWLLTLYNCACLLWWCHTRCMVQFWNWANTLPLYKEWVKFVEKYYWELWLAAEGLIFFLWMMYYHLLNVVILIIMLILYLCLFLLIISIMLACCLILWIRTPFMQTSYCLISFHMSLFNL